MAGGAAPAPKQDELQPHPVKDQLPNISYCITSPPPWPEAILLGFQHYLVMLGTTVLIPASLVPQMGGGFDEKAKVIQTLLFIAGLNTLTQSLFGSRLPAVVGGSFTFVPTTISIIQARRYDNIVDPHEKFEKTMRGIQGALIVASTLQIVLGFSGLWRNVTRLRNVWKLDCLRSSYCLFFHRIRVPYPFQWGAPTFDAGETFAMMMASFVALVESTGTYIAASRYASATPLPPSVLSRGIGWQGVGILLSGLFGTVTGSTVSTENAGLLALTRVGSRRVVQISAGFMLFFSILGKFGVVFASIPAPMKDFFHAKFHESSPIFREISPIFCEISPIFQIFENTQIQRYFAIFRFLEQSRNGRETTS